MRRIEGSPVSEHMLGGTSSQGSYAVNRLRSAKGFLNYRVGRLIRSGYRRLQEVISGETAAEL